ncbi:MAG: creatininase family protein [Planctomycetota bacterium]|nr:creatininase family protein [Planctomycetota bacterium]
MSDLAKHTWPEAAELFGPDVVAFVPIGSTEPHGPHLPLDTDVTIAEAQARRAAERLEAYGIRTVLLPAVPYGVTRWTDGFAGTIGLRPGTLWAILEDIIGSLEDQGVRRIVFSNGHLEPAHIEVLRGVPLDHQGQDDETATVVFPDNTRRRWAQTLGDEFASGECHAGRYESSIVLAADGDAVRPVRSELPDVQIGLIERIKAGARNFQECGADQAYCGAPADASTAEGEELIERLATMVVETVRETWPELFA